MKKTIPLIFVLFIASLCYGFLSRVEAPKPKTLDFCIVSKPGVITNQRGNIIYFCQDGHDIGIDRYAYEISLSSGTYAYYNLDKSDTISFAIDKTGAYKLGFYEDHKSFAIYKQNPFSN